MIGLSLTLRDGASRLLRVRAKRFLHSLILMLRSVQRTRLEACNPNLQNQTSLTCESYWQHLSISRHGTLIAATIGLASRLLPSSVNGPAFPSSPPMAYSTTPRIGATFRTCSPRSA